MSYVVTERNTIKVKTILIAVLVKMISLFTTNMFLALHGLYTIETYLPSYVV